ncbi:DUF402 domain-containing protein [Streptomyces sp. CA-111067]|uniref:DUF402 domain-containing protein n=1 Tax=Streptomyces sp. CA-111067 TaxID=3240046 RepID=UPI003D96B23D
MPGTTIRLLSGASTTVRLVKHDRVKLRYPADVLSDDGVRATVRAPYAAPSVRDFGFVRFEPGDVFTEHFWRDRFYSVKEVRDAGGTVKGWYCDIGRPAVVGADGVTMEDLDLDLWVSADGSQVLRLDEDEFADSGLAERDPEAARSAVQALDGLEALVLSGGLTRLLG